MTNPHTPCWAIASRFLVVALLAAGHAGFAADTQINTGFDGPTGADTFWWPNDPNAATGPNHVMDIINGIYRIYNKSGTLVASGGLDGFFSSLTPGVATLDPNITYDDIAQRFVLEANGSGGDITNAYFAVSNTSDPTQGFTEVHKIGFAGAYDGSKIGFNADVYVICATTGTAVIQKSSVLDSNNATFTIVSQTTSTYGRAARMNGALTGGPMYFTSASGGQIRVTRLDNVLSNAPTYTSYNVAGSSGCSDPATPGWRNNSLVTANTGAMYWWQVDTSTTTPTLVQQGFQAPQSGFTTGYGSANIAPNGDLGVSWMEYSASTNLLPVKMWVAWRSAADPTNFLRVPIMVRTSGSVIQANGRHGDFSSTVCDINTNGVTLNTFWSCNGYIRSPGGEAVWNQNFGGTPLLPPSITTQPTNVTVVAGNPLTLSVTNVGAQPFSYQWLKNGTNISGATTNPFAISITTNTDGGNYTVVVTNNEGSVTSAVAVVTIVPANDSVWINPAGGSWTNTANWSGGVVATGPGKTANFNTLNLTASPTVNLDGARSIGYLIFGDTTPSHNWTLATGAGGPLTLDALSGSPAITVSNQSATISAVLAGVDGLLKFGAGTLTLSGANTYTGGTTISNGLVLDGIASTTSGAFGTFNAAASTVNVLNGATVDINGKASGSDFFYGLTLAGSGTSGQGALVNNGTSGGSGQRSTPNLALAANATIGGSGNIYMINQGYAADALSLNGFTLTKTGANTFYFCNTTVSGGGAIAVNSGTISQSTTASTAGGTAFVLANTSGVALNLNNLSLSVGSLSGGGAAGGNVSLGSATLTVGGDNTSPGPFAGVISGTGGLIKTGAGVLTLSGNNTYTGSTIVSNGILAGTGVIRGPVTNLAGSTLAPGINGIGTLSISNALTLQGAVFAEINRTAGTADKVQGVTTLTYGGLLSVMNLAGTLTTNDTFTLFSASSYAGSFAGVNLPPLGSGMTWDTSSLSVNGSLKVVGFTGVNPATNVPANLTATPVSPSQINVSWTATPEATSYLLSRNGTPFATVIGTNFTDTGLGMGVTYCYAVAGVNSGGSSASGPSTCATTYVSGSTLTWDASTGTSGIQDGGGNWGSAGTPWQYGGNNVVWNNGNSAAFGVSTTTNCTVTLTNNVAPAGINFNATGGGTYTIAGTNSVLLTNNVTINAGRNATISTYLNGPGTLVSTGAPSAILTLSAGNGYSGGTVVNGGRLTATGGGWYAARSIGTGSLSVSNGATAQFTQAHGFGVGTGGYGVTINNATLQFDHENYVSGLDMTGGSVIGAGEIRTTGATYNFNGAATNSLITCGVNMVSAGTFNVADGPSMVDLLFSGYLSNGGTLTKTGAGLMRYTGTQSGTSPVTISAGVLQVDGVLNSSSVMIMGTLTLAQRQFVTVVTMSGGTLGGTGTINGPVTQQALATLAPGGITNLGTLTINNTISLNGIASFRISKNSGVITNDQVRGMTGEVYTDTTLLVTNITTDGTPLAQDDTFQLFARASGSFVGEVLYFDLPALPTNLVWDVSSIEADGALRVAALPVITNQPQSLAVNAGSPAGFTVGAVGSGELTYQWQKDGADIVGAATNLYTIASASPASAGNYTVVVTSDFGSVTSSVAVLTVLVPPVITGSPVMGAGGFQLTFNGPAGQTYKILTSTNLILPVASWAILTNGTFTGSPVTFTNSVAPGSVAGYYRLASP